MSEIRRPFTPKKNTLYLHRKQVVVYRARSRFKVVVAGRRWGKTVLAGAMMIRFVQVKRRLVWYVAPSYRMAKQIMWPVLMEMIPAKWIKKVNETTLTITLRNGTRVELKGADNPDSLRGVGVHYLVMDEVQDIDPVAWTKVLRPTLASTGGHALFIGTPKAYNFLYDLYMLGQDPGNQERGIWMSWQFPTMTSPFIPKSEIDAAARDMDEKSFNQEFNACHLPETRVLLWTGSTKAIKDVVVGDVLTHLGKEGVTYPCDVLDIGITGLKQVVDVIIETGEVISASNRHKFKVHVNE